MFTYEQKAEYLNFQKQLESYFLKDSFQHVLHLPLFLETPCMGLHCR